MTLQFVAVGNAPLMKRTKFTVTGHDQLSVVRSSQSLMHMFLLWLPLALTHTYVSAAAQVYKFLKKQLRLKDTDALVRPCMCL